MVWPAAAPYGLFDGNTGNVFASQIVCEEHPKLCEEAVGTVCRLLIGSVDHLPVDGCLF